MTKSIFAQYLEKGFVSDLFQAQMHYFIFRTIGENYLKLNDVTSEAEKGMFGHIQRSSHDLAILFLSKVFEPKKHRRHTCLDSVLGKCEMQESLDFPIAFQDWMPLDWHYPELQNLAKISGLELPNTGFANPTKLVNYLRDLLKTNEVNAAILSLIRIRDRKIAHNQFESKFLSIEDFWDQYDLLQRIGRLYLILLNKCFASTHYSFDYEVKPNSIDINVMSECTWLVEFLSKKIGHRNIVSWWL